MRNIKLRVGTVQEWGKTGENNAAALVLDVTENLSLWPDGQPQAVYYRPDGTVYPLPCSLSGSTVEVPLTATETATVGRAQIEIQWIDEGVLAKSATHSGNIAQSLAEPGEEPPEPMQSWLDQLTGLAGDAAEAAEDAAVAQGLAEDARDEAQGYATGMTTAIEEALEPITEELALKADKATTYTKTEADAAAGAAIAAAIAPVTSQLADIALWRTTTGNPVTCYPVPGSPLLPRIAFTATQEGSGDPSPENIRPIVPALVNGGKVTLSHSDGVITPTQYEWTAPQDIYGLPGAETYVDWDAGELVVQDVVAVLDGSTDEGWTILNSGNSDWYYTSNILSDAPNVAGNVKRICTHFPNGGVANNTTNTGFDIVWGKPRIRYGTELPITEFKAMLAANPITIVYQLATPIRIPLTDLPAIPALPQLDRYTPRQNVLTVDKGTLTVGYAKSPIRESDELAAAIAALA